MLILSATTAAFRLKIELDFIFVDSVAFSFHKQADASKFPIVVGVRAELIKCFIRIEKIHVIPHDPAAKIMRPFFTGHIFLVALVVAAYKLYILESRLEY